MPLTLTVIGVLVWDQVEGDVFQVWLFHWLTSHPSHCYKHTLKKRESQLSPDEVYYMGVGLTSFVGNHPGNAFNGGCASGAHTSGCQEDKGNKGAGSDSVTYNNKVINQYLNECQVMQLQQSTNN